MFEQKLCELRRCDRVRTNGCSKSWKIDYKIANLKLQSFVDISDIIGKASQNFPSLRVLKVSTKMLKPSASPTNSIKTTIFFKTRFQIFSIN